jgi:hypothetical protein
MALFRAEIFYTKIRILARICTIVDKIDVRILDVRICKCADVQMLYKEGFLLTSIGRNMSLKI